MVDGEGAHLHSHFHTARIGQLAGVYLRAHTIFGSCLQYAACLLGREETTVAEHVDEVGQSLASHGGNHLAHHQVHIVGLPTGVSPSYGMGTEEGRHDFYLRCAFQFLDHAQNLQLVGGIQTITALDLHTSRTTPFHIIEPLLGLCVQQFFRCVVKQVGGVEYATATSGNLLVGESAYLVGELSFAATGVDDVGMAVAPTGQHGTSLGVDDLGGGIPEGILHRLGPLTIVLSHGSIETETAIVDQ